MIRLVVLSALACAVLGQGHGGYNSYQNELTTPAYPRNYHPPAPVHYVNIGQELAGDYKFGYDTGKGPLGQSFREETRLPDGTVKGAYGVLDEQGRQRIIRYTAGKNGFVAEGDVGPNGSPGVAPGPAPQPVANPHAAAAPVAAARAYQPAPVQQYRNPAPAAQYRPAPAAQYRSAPAAAGRYDDGQWDPRKDDPYYQDGPAFIDVERLSYDIGAARRG